MWRHRHSPKPRQAGIQVSGFKVVAGCSIRKYADEGAVAEAAKAVGYTDILGDLVVKPAGKPTLVPEADKRPALTVKDAATAVDTVSEAAG